MIMLQFAAYMKAVIMTKTHSVVRAYLAEKERNGNVYIEDLELETADKLLSISDEIIEEEFDFIFESGDTKIGISSSELIDILNSLTPAERKALLLGIGDELSTRDLAIEMNILDKSAVTQKSKALSKARKKAGKNGKDRKA